MSEGQPSANSRLQHSRPLPKKTSWHNLIKDQILITRCQGHAVLPSLGGSIGHASFSCSELLELRNVINIYLE